MLDPSCKDGMVCLYMFAFALILVIISCVLKNSGDEAAEDEKMKHLEIIVKSISSLFLNKEIPQGTCWCGP